MSILLLLLSVASAQHSTRYSVRPRDGPLSCADGEPCLTIDEYAESASEYFTDGSAFMFLAGNHSLKTMLDLTGTRDVTFTGETSSSQSNTIIFCELNATILCDNVTNMKIKHYTIP